jgi:short-subunit dehydrogenase
MSTTKVSKEQRRTITLERVLANEVVIVTGASSGIGAATARELARYGAQVVLAARREDELAKQVAEITAAGNRAVAIATDISDSTQITRLVDQVLERFGHIDVLVNNAGVGWQEPFADESVERIDQMLDINLRGAILATHAVLPGMLEQRHGAIIAVASVAGHIAISSLYSATKYGLRGFMLALRRELAGTGVAASVVSPGFIRTALSGNSRFPVPGPEVVARTIADLVVKPRREVIVPGYYAPLVAISNSLPRLLDIGLRASGATPSMRKKR